MIEKIKTYINGSLNKWLPFIFYIAVTLAGFYANSRIVEYRLDAVCITMEKAGKSIDDISKSITNLLVDTAKLSGRIDRVEDKIDDHRKGITHK